MLTSEIKLKENMEELIDHLYKAQQRREVENRDHSQDKNNRLISQQPYLCLLVIQRE
jgi:hypothetical protein